MIVSGVEHMLKMCIYNHSSPENHIYFTIRLILYILLRWNSFYGLITSVANKFIENRSLECALVDMLVLSSKYRVEIQAIRDTQAEFARLGTIDPIPIMK